MSFFLLDLIFMCMGILCCMYICVPGAMKVRSGCQIPWDSYNHRVDIGIESGVLTAPDYLGISPAPV